MKTYKIVEYVNGKIKTLFHGVDGSRTVDTEKWIEAKVGYGIDGSGQKEYLHGWHSFATIELAKKYLNNFRARKELLRIAECEITEDKWEKPTNSDVILSRFIKFISIIN